MATRPRDAPEILRQIVEAFAVVRRQVQTHARQRERVVAKRARPVLSLPPTAALEADARANRMVHSVSEEMRRRGKGEAGLVDRRAEQQPEVGSSGAKVGAGREGQIDLQATWKQKHPIDGPAALKIEKSDAVELARDAVGPISKDRGNGREEIPE